MNTTKIMILSALGTGLIASTTLASQDLKRTFSDPILGNMPYHVFLPDNFSSAAPGSIPIILYLHGAGERGNDNLSQLGYINSLINETQHGTHKAILITPQVASNASWSNVDWYAGSYHNDKQPAVSNSMLMAMNILSQVQSTYAQDDTNRVYVTGLSMGGYGSWDAIQRYHNIFAAAMPLSGGGNIDLAPMLADRGIWAWHGITDGSVPISASDQMIAAIRAAGGNPIYDRVPNIGHSNWGDFYNGTSTAQDAGMYDWLFSQTLAPEPGTFALTLGAGAMMLRRRRKQRA